MYTFKEDAYFMIDRTYVNFKDCSFHLIDKNEEGILIQLTNDGKNQIINNIKSRDHKHGTDDYLIEFLIDELQGKLFIMQEGDDDITNSEEYEQVLDAITNYTIKGGKHA